MPEQGSQHSRKDRRQRSTDQADGHRPVEFRPRVTSSSRVHSQEERTRRATSSGQQDHRRSFNSSKEPESYRKGNLEPNRAYSRAVSSKSDDGYQSRFQRAPESWSREQSRERDWTNLDKEHNHLGERNHPKWVSPGTKTRTSSRDAEARMEIWRTYVEKKE